LGANGLHDADHIWLPTTADWNIAADRARRASLVAENFQKICPNLATRMNRFAYSLHIRILCTPPICSILAAVMKDRNLEPTNPPSNRFPVTLHRSPDRRGMKVFWHHPEFMNHRNYDAKRNILTASFRR
jgi:hypothetical protein